jgi:hypothetical protein
MGRKKPGPKAGQRNPYPHPLVDAETEVRFPDGRWEWVRLPLFEVAAWLAVEEIDVAERALRKSFKARRRDLQCRPGETQETATWRIRGLAREVLEENAADLEWTGRRREDTQDVPVDRLYPMTREGDDSWTVRYVGPDPKPDGKGPKRGDEWRYRITPRPQQRQDATGTWKPMDTPAWVIEHYDAAAQSWKPGLCVPAKNEADAESWLKIMARPTPWRLKVTWPGLVTSLRDPIGRMVRAEMGRAGKDGRPAYLAYVTLGVLLDTTPERIRTLLDNFRNPRPSRRRSKG